MNTYWDRKVDENKFKNARQFKKANYFTEGNYTLEVICMKMINSERTGKDAFIAEFRILETDSNDPFMKAGEEAAYFVDMEQKYKEYAYADVQALLTACVHIVAKAKGREVDMEQVDLLDVAKKATGEDNIFGGVKLHLKATPRRNKNPDNDIVFLNYQWY